MDIKSVDSDIYAYDRAARMRYLSENGRIPPGYNLQCPEVINKVLNPEAIPAKIYYICKREMV